MKLTHLGVRVKRKNEQLLNARPETPEGDDGATSSSFDDLEGRLRRTRSAPASRGRRRRERKRQQQLRGLLRRLSSVRVSNPIRSGTNASSGGGGGPGGAGTNPAMVSEKAKGKKLGHRRVQTGGEVRKEAPAQLAYQCSSALCGRFR